MKTTLWLSFALVLTTCEQQPAPTSSKKPVIINSDSSGMDSPIIISDGSAHLRHKGGSRGDFQILGNTNVQVNDTDLGYTVSGIDCLHTSGCPRSSDISAGGWTLDVPNPAGGASIMTLKSDQATNSILTATFNGYTFVTTQENSDTAHGVDLSAVDAKGATLSFQSFSFTPNGGASTTYTCQTTAAKPHCKVCIHYKNPSKTTADSSVCSGP